MANRKSRLLIVGAGGFGRAVAEAVLAAGEFEVAGFVDDRYPKLGPIWGHAVLGTLAHLQSFRERADAAVIAVGDNQCRRDAFLFAQECGFELASIVHLSAFVSRSALIGRGVTVMAGAIVGCEARVHDGAIINTGAIVDHHAEVQVFAHLGAGACMPGGSSLGAGSRLSERCALRPGQRVGSNLMVGIDTRLEG